MNSLVRFITGRFVGPVSDACGNSKGFEQEGMHTAYSFRSLMSRSRDSLR
jgi:hypothetical protein